MSPMQARWSSSASGNKAFFSPPMIPISPKVSRWMEARQAAGTAGRSPTTRGTEPAGRWRDRRGEAEPSGCRTSGASAASTLEPNRIVSCSVSNVHRESQDNRKSQARNRRKRSQGSQKKVEQVFNLFGKRDRMGERQQALAKRLRRAGLLRGRFVRGLLHDAICLPPFSQCGGGVPRHRPPRKVLPMSPVNLLPMARFIP